MNSCEMQTHSILGSRGEGQRCTTARGANDGGGGGGGEMAADGQSCCACIILIVSSLRFQEPLPQCDIGESH